MEYLIITLKSVVAYFILMLLGVNLIGGIIRGFVTARVINNDSTAKKVYGKGGDNSASSFYVLMLGFSSTEKFFNY